MTETVSLFFYALVLFFSFLYLKQQRLWQLAIVEILSMFVIGFRMSYLLVVQISAVLLPLIAFFPEIRAVFGKHSSTLSKLSGLKSAGLHLAFSVLFMFLLQQGYRQLNGRLASREPALLHNTGLSILTTWAPALKPTDSPDPRLSELIARRPVSTERHMVKGRSALFAWRPCPPMEADRAERRDLEPGSKADSIECVVASPNGRCDAGRQDILRLLEFQTHP